MPFPAYHNNPLPPNKTSPLYLTMLLLLIAVIVALPLVHTTISVKTTGIIRPAMERTELKPAVSGIIDTIYYIEGDTIPANAVLLKLRDNVNGAKQIQAHYEISQRQQFIADLQLLTSMGYITQSTVGNLQSALYKQQIAKFLFQQADQQGSIKKAQKELAMDTALAADKVIAPKELFDKQVENERLQANYNAFRQTQLAEWQQDLVKYKLELSQLQAQQHQIGDEAKLYVLRAPIGGIVQGINNRYVGGLLQAGEVVCNISPEANLLAECYVSTKDVGLLKKGETATFQIDAFDYNFFGILNGKIQSIDNDFTVMDNKPVFKVHCLFDHNQLHLKNGYTGQLKKGLTFQSRFVVAERTLWQLLWDKMDDWFNPGSPNV